MMNIAHMSDLKKGSSVHLIGICGTAMASLAGLLKDRGFQVSGSDANPYPPMSTQIESLGIQIKSGYRAENLHPKPDFVIVGNVVSANNPEAQELMKLGIPFTSLPKAMGEFIIGERDSVCISGTHGKTTTTSLMSWVAEVCGQSPGFLIGGIPLNFSKSFRNPEKNLFIIEGDEYDTAFFDKVPKFTHYRPKYTVLTSVEFDHADIYKDLDDVKKAFATLMKITKPEGQVIAWAEDKNVESLLGLAKAPVLTYGLKKGDVRATILKVKGEATIFSVNFKGEDLGEFHLPLSGEYNVLNALAVIALSKVLNFDFKLVKQAFESFKGVKRRQEILGEPRGVLIIEDFAHHPTAVKETIRGIKAKYPERKLWAVFEPRSATSRRKIFQKDYAIAFSLAEETLIAEAFDQTKLDETNRFSSAELVEDLKREGKSAQVYSKVDEIVGDLSKKTTRGDLVLIMSNGGFDGIYTKLLKAMG
jgi:UDP-N-acetylmuramate: L-alanyl-gamma-D-glutamyl-meso-diaminopimelate ligase